MKQGLRCSVYRNADLGDCTNGGITSQVSRVTLVGEGVPEIFSPNSEAPALELFRRPYGSLGARPLDWMEREGAGPMFGGNFIYTSDSRLPGGSPIPVHDRFESWELYERLLR